LLLKVIRIFYFRGSSSLFRYDIFFFFFFFFC